MRRKGLCIDLVNNFSPSFLFVAVIRYSKNQPGRQMFICLHHSESLKEVRAKT